MPYFITSREFTCDIYDVLVVPDDVPDVPVVDESVHHGLGLERVLVEVHLALSSSLYPSRLEFSL